MKRSQIMKKKNMITNIKNILIKKKIIMIIAMKKKRRKKMD